MGERDDSSGFYDLRPRIGSGVWPELGDGGVGSICGLDGGDGRHGHLLIQEVEDPPVKLERVPLVSNQFALEGKVFVGRAGLLLVNPSSQQNGQT